MTNTQQNGGLKYLAKNVLLLTISNFASKILVFLLIPLYTSVLSTAEYGTFDLFNTTVSLLIPVLTANISEAVLRFALDKGADHCSIFEVGLRYVGASICFVCIAVIFLSSIGAFPMFAEWWPMFVLLYVTHALHALTSNFARGLDRVRDVAIAGVVASVVLVSLNILFLIPLGMGLAGYFIASLLSTSTQIACLIVGARMWRYVGKHSRNRELECAMRAYSLPLAANSVAWWVNSVSDRYVVTMFCGVADNGIYSVGSKIPQILNVIQVIFNQAWVLSAVKDIDAKDESGFFRKTYNAYGFLMVIACSILIVLDKPLAMIMYSNDFFEAWRYVPFLMISMVFGALAGHLGGVFAAVKDSRLYAQSTIAGAVSNVILNLMLVPIMGPLGASIATAVSYWMVWVIRRRIVRRHITITFSLLRDYVSYIILVMQGIWLIVFNGYWVALYGIELALMAIVVVLYRQEVSMWIGLIPRVINSLRARYTNGK